MKSLLRAVGASLVGMLALSGCIRMDSDLVLYEDNTLDQVIEYAFDQSLMRLAAGEEGVPDIDELIGSADDFELIYRNLGFDDVVVEAIDTEDEAGLRITVTGASLDELNAIEIEDSGTPTATTVREGDTFRVVIPAKELVDQLSAEEGVGVNELAAILDMNNSVTFPGPIIESSGGTIEGNTITWTTRDIISGEELYAVGKASPDSGLPLWVWIALGALVLAAVAVVVIVQTRRSRASLADAPPPGMAGAMTPPPPAASSRVEGADEPPAAKKPAPKKPAAKKPATTKPAAKKPAAKKPAPKDSPTSGDNTK